MTPREETPTFDSMFWWFEEFADGVTKAVQEVGRVVGDALGARVREQVERTRLFYQLLREAMLDPQGFLEEYGNYYNEDGDWIGPQRDGSSIIQELIDYITAFSLLFLRFDSLFPEYHPMNTMFSDFLTLFRDGLFSNPLSKLFEELDKMTSGTVESWGNNPSWGVLALFGSTGLLFAPLVWPGVAIGTLVAFFAAMFRMYG